MSGLSNSTVTADPSHVPHPDAGAHEVRGDGLIAVVELVADKATKKPFERLGAAGARAFDIANEEGLILRSIGDALALCPPLAITEKEVKEIVTRMPRVVERTHEWVGAEGLD